MYLKVMIRKMKKIVLEKEEDTTKQGGGGKNALAPKMTVMATFFRGGS